MGRCWVTSIELVLLSTTSSHGISSRSLCYIGGFVNIAFFEVVTLLCYVCFRSSRSSIFRGRQLYTVNQNPESHWETVGGEPEQSVIDAVDEKRVAFGCFPKKD